MKTLLFRASQVLSCQPQNGLFKRQNELNDLGLFEDFSIIIEDETITEISNKISTTDFKRFDLVFDCKNKVIIPGIVDPHTHLIFAGSRSDEFEMRVSGLTYEQIAAKGGGIIKTVNATRNASKEELKISGHERLKEALSLGVTTIEIKSGYGLDFNNEVKMLEVINELNEEQPIEIIPTFLGAHTIPNEYSQNREAYVKSITDSLIPYLSQKKLAKYCDVFLERSAFSYDETKDILKTAIKFGMKPKLHADQFNSLGGVSLAVELEVCSIDHLEVTNDADIKKLSKTDIACVILPGVSYFIKIPYSSARKMIDEGCIVALGTDFNPGSCMSQNVFLIMNIASLYNQMNLNETINAFTINSAYALGLSKKVGSIEIGKQADLIILNTNDYKNIVYYFGKNFVQTVIKRGIVVYERNH